MIFFLLCQISNAKDIKMTNGLFDPNRCELLDSYLISVCPLNLIGLTLSKSRSIWTITPVCPPKRKKETEMIDTKFLVPFRWSSVLFPLATNIHWFSLPVGPLWLAAIGPADRGPTKKDRQFCVYHLRLWLPSGRPSDCLGTISERSQKIPQPLSKQRHLQGKITGFGFPWQ